MKIFKKNTWHVIVKQCTFGLLAPEVIMLSTYVVNKGVVNVPESVKWVSPGGVTIEGVETDFCRVTRVPTTPGSNVAASPNPGFPRFDVPFLNALYKTNKF